MKVFNNISHIDLNEFDYEFIDFCKKNASMIIDMSLDELSKQMYISPSSITNVLKKIGFSNFNDFKFNLKRDLYRLSNSSLDNSENLLKLIESDLLEMQTNLDLYYYEEIATQIKKSERIVVYGTGLNSAVANYFYNNLLTLDMYVVLISELHFLKHLAENDNNISTLIIYSNRLQDEKFLDVLTIFKNTGVKVILITSKDSNSDSIKLVDFVIRTTDEERIFNSMDTNSRIGYYLSTQILIELLVSNTD